jgi:hypothetical protein
MIIKKIPLSIACILIVIVLCSLFYYYHLLSSDEIEYACDYNISVTGLDNFYNNMTNYNIIIPLPAIGNKAILNEKSYEVKSFGPWVLKMFSLEGKNFMGFMIMNPLGRKLTDISANFSIAGSVSRSDIDGCGDIFNGPYLYPVCGNRITNYTVWAFDERDVKNYTTYVYFDGFGPGPDSDEGKQICMYIELTANSFTEDSDNKCADRMVIREIIPGGLTGLIPVKVQLAEYENGTWRPIKTTG